MNERPEQRPEGRLIALAQKHSRMSQREVAKRAGISEARWRNIVSGYQTVSAGTYAAIRGPADTVARMAQAVGVTPEQLEAADREDAAAELRELPPLQEPEVSADIDEQVEKLTAEIQEIRKELRELRELRQGDRERERELAEELEKLRQQPS